MDEQPWIDQPARELVASRNKPEDWARNVLDYDPYEGDYGNGRTLLNTICIAARKGRCFTCEGDITKGMLVRVLKGVDEDGFYGGRHCELCCDAMALESAALAGEITDDDAYDAAMRAIDARHAARHAAPGVPDAR